MRAFLIDTSGSFPASEMTRVRDLLRVGDRVIMFDTRVYDKGIIDSHAAITMLQFEGGGGTCITNAMTFVGKHCPNAPVTIVTDGFIYDVAEAVEVADFYMIKVDEVLPFLDSDAAFIQHIKEAFS